MRRVAMALLGTILICPSALASPTTLELNSPQFLDNSVGRLFPGAQRLGASLELPVQGDWSLSLAGMFLHKDWGTANYALALTPVMIRHRTLLAAPNSPVLPFLSLGGGCTAMTLFGANPGLQSGLGPAFAGGIGLDVANQYRLKLETQFGQVNAIRYMGLMLGVGMMFGGPTLKTSMVTSAPGPMVPPSAPSAPSARVERPLIPEVRVVEKPPLPQGRLVRIGRVEASEGNTLKLSLDQIPYRIEPGDTLVVYYVADLPIKIAKIRITQIDPATRTARAEAIARTESIRRGYLVGTL